MSIRRVRLAFESQFVQIPNEWMRDARLSRRARGLLAEIMTHEAGWEITVESLVAKGPEGRDAIRGAIQELEAAGYLRRERRKVDGQFGGMDYVLQEPTELRIPSVGKSDVGKTYVGESATKNTKLKEDHHEEHKPKLPSPSDDFLDWYLVYPRKEARNKALQAYIKARRSVSAEVLLAGARRYAEDPNRLSEYTKLPASWLNAGCWEDDPLPTRGAPQHPVRPPYQEWD